MHSSRGSLVPHKSFGTRAANKFWVEYISTFEHHELKTEKAEQPNSNSNEAKH